MHRPAGRHQSSTIPAAALVVVALVAAACGPAPISTTVPGTGATSASPSTSQPALATPGPTPGPTLDRVTGWRSDLERLVPGMDAIHPELTHGATRAALDGAVASLIDEIAVSTDDRLMVGVLRIVAMVSAAGCDAHTGAFVWGSGSYSVDSIPFRLWLFEDEVVVVDALPPYEALIGSRIDAIEGRPISEVVEALDPIIPRDNDQTVRLLLPRYLLIPQVLHGLGIADEGPVALNLTSASGTASVELIEAVPMAEYNGWAGPYGLHLPADPDILYLSRIDDAIWWQLLPDAETLYVQYNRADLLPAGTLNDLQAALDDPEVTRVVLDVRHNFGGELRALDPIVEMFSDPEVNQPDRVFVLTGRNTFSAGSLLVARMAETDAVIVGETAGGCPTIFSDSSELILPFSGIVVNVAGDTAVGVRPDDERLTIEPDVIATLSREDWSDGRDRALEAIVVVAP